MQTLPAKIDPIVLPPSTRPTAIPSLPGWAALQVATCSVEYRPDERGHWRNALTLPADLMPTELHRQALVSHIEALERFMAQTPERDEAAAKATLVTVTKLLLALPSAKLSETGAEARGEAFMVALEDVPCWATAEAVKGWYRGSH